MPVVIAGLILSQAFSNILIDNNQKKNLQLTEQIAKKIDDNTLKFILSVASIMNDNDIIPSVNKWDTISNEENKFELSNEINTKLQYYFNYTTDINGIYFIFKNNSCYKFKSPLTNEISELKNMQWYKEMKSSNEKIKVLGRIKNSQFTQINNNGNYSISIAANTHAIDKYPVNEVEMVYFTFRENTFDKLYSGLKLSNVGRIDIVNQEGSLITSGNSNISEILKEQNILKNDYGWFRYTKNNEDLLFTYYPVPSTGWKVINTTSYKELTSGVDRIVTILIAIFIAVFVLFIIVFFASTMSTIVLPIKHLIYNMKKVEEGNFKTGIPIRGEDELALLNASFNNMVKEIQNLVHKIETEKNEKLQLEIRTLQYQINPHFLFNTLNSIKMMAGIYGVDNIEKMTEALTKLLMNTLEKGGMFTTVEKEFETLKSYIYLMKVRYGDRFNAIFSLSNEVKNLYILKLLLQPIVENAILHGMKEDIFEKLIINIDARQNSDKLIITVSDNGVGMDKDMLEKILENNTGLKRGFSRIGVENVNRRIKLNHGDVWGLNITSSVGSGTSVSFELPVILDLNEYEKEGDKYVQNITC
jgi:two-component system sensor histidine kinase YesM